MRPSPLVLGLSGLFLLATTACQDLPLHPPPSRAPVERGAPTPAIRSVAVGDGITMVDLGPALRVNGINDSGYVVGQSVHQLAALWSPSGAMQEIRATCPPPCWPYPAPGCDPSASSGCATNPQHDVPSEATAINKAGQVVGYYRYDERYLTDFRGGFLWSAARGFTDIWSHHDGTYPYAINDSGQIAGSAIFTGGCCGHAFRRSAAGVMTDLGTIGGGTSFAYGIDNLGEVVGISPGPSMGDAILWQASGGYVSLGPSDPLQAATALGINDSGVVVGYWYRSTSQVGFRWTQQDGMQPLPGGGLSATAVNRDGYIVGRIATGTPYPHAALWTPDGQVIDLGSLGGSSGATAINSHLQVAGSSIDPAGVQHAVRWDVTIVHNRPPVASAGGPYTGMEGSPVLFAGNASDPDGDALTLSWSFGDGSAATGASPSHTYVDDGSYPVVLTATDPQGASATSTTIATVANVPPSVHEDALAPIASGDSIALRATFTDPGILDTPWRYTIDWGTGAPTAGATTSQGDAIVARSPRYCAAGMYTVRTSVSDKDDGTGSAAQTLAVSRFAIAVHVQAGVLNTRSRGQLPVAVLSSARFDARQLDIASVLLGSATDPGISVARHRNGRYLADIDDVNGDGRPDLVLHFERDLLASHGILAAPATELVLTGQLVDRCGQVRGADVVRVRAKRP